MYYIQSELQPTPGSEHFAIAGGAVANCFVSNPSATEALKMALLNFSENGWLVVSVGAGPTAVRREQYLEELEWLEWFDQAATEGECYVYHVWPPNPQDGEEVH